MVEARRSAVVSGRPLTWRGWLGIVAVADTVTLGGVAAAIGDREALAITAAMIVALALWLRFRRVGAILLALLLTDVGLFTASAAFTNAFSRQPLVWVVLPGAIGTLSLVGLVAAVASVIRPAGGRVWAPRVAALGAGAFVVLLVVAAVAPQASAAGSGALRIRAKNTAYSTTSLVAEGGQVTVRFANDDVFWHTFSIPALGVDLPVPVGGEQEVTFDAPPGTYTYVCGIPGHASAGMRGTLVVR